MATLVLGAVGTAIGGSIGGGILGISAATIGGFVGSAIGSAVDSWIVSSLTPAQRVEGPRLDSLRITSSTEGAVVPRVFGRMRMGGNVIWAVSCPNPLVMYDQAVTQGSGGTDWLFRYKDLVNWWSNAHNDRPGGNALMQSTPWVPQSKPIRFTELGCPAIDRGTNQPNVFFDPKSSESFVPYFSRGWRDDAIQRA